MLVIVEGMMLAAEVRFNLPKQRKDIAKLRQIVGVHSIGDDGLMTAACRGHGAKVRLAIGEHSAPRSHRSSIVRRWLS